MCGEMQANWKGRGHVVVGDESIGRIGLDETASLDETAKC